MPPSTDATLDRPNRCPKCGGAMAEKKDHRGTYLRCLRWRDCGGLKRLDVPPSKAAAADAPPDMPRPLRLSAQARATLAVTVAAGLAGNADVEQWGPDDIAETALRIVDEIVSRCPVLPGGR